MTGLLHPPIARTVRTFKRAMLACASIALLGLALQAIILTRPGLAQGHGGKILPISLAVLSLALVCDVFLFYIAGRKRSARTEKIIRWLTELRIGLTLLFLLLQVSVVCLCAALWLNIRLVSEAFISGAPLFVWLLLSSITACAGLISFYSQTIVNIFQNKIVSSRAVLLTAAALAAGFLAAWNFTQTYMLPLFSAASPLITNVDLKNSLGLGFPVMIVDLLIVVAALIPTGTGTRFSIISARIPRLKAGLVSFALTGAFWGSFLAIFQIGYGSNDDLPSILMTSGYIGGAPTEFFVHSNVLWGLLLKILYQAQTQINWAILLYAALLFLSAWTLLCMLFSLPVARLVKLFGAVSILAFSGYFLINITYTTAAAAAAIAGLAAILYFVRSGPGGDRRSLVLGSLLVLVSSLIRLNSTLLVAGCLAPILIFEYRSFINRKALGALVLTAILVSGAWSFDRAYTRKYPDWQAFMAFDQTRVGLHDTPRIERVSTETLNAVGWSANDLYVFANWFYPDPQVFSQAHLQYIVEHTSDQRSSLSDVTQFLWERIFNPEAYPYLLLVLAAGLFAQLYAVSKKQFGLAWLGLAWSLSAAVLLCWKMKLPFRVLDPIFACAAYVELFSLAASSREADPIVQRPAYPKFVTRLVRVVGVSLSLLAVAMICTQWSADSNLNRQHQSAYLHILTDLDGLQQKEILDKDALIVSPAYGIPQQWEDPLTLNPPKVKFMLMAWTTSSPAYTATLQQFQVQSLPAGLYQNKNVYLMAQYTLLPAIRQYILEHDGVTVTVKDLYALPVGDLDPYYGQVHLFQLARQ